MAKANTRSMSNKKSDMFYPNVPVKSLCFDDPKVEALRAQLDVIKGTTEMEQLLLGCVSALFEKIDELSLTLAKTEQYSRRETIVVSGVQMTEQENLPAIVVNELAKSGVTVSENDFQAIHRNAPKSKIIEKDDGKKITVPPAITVKFFNTNTKDKILRQYKNFDSSKNKKRKVRVFQSLTPHYTDLKKQINTYCNDQNIELQWIHYRSPTCGFAVKLEEGKLITKIHCMKQFTHIAKYLRK